MKVFSELFRLKVNNGKRKRVGLAVCFIFAINLLFCALILAAPTDVNTLNIASSGINEVSDVHVNAAIIVCNNKGKDNFACITTIKIGFNNKMSKMDVIKDKIYNGLVLAIDEFESEIIMYNKVIETYFTGAIAKVLDIEAVASQLYNFDVPMNILYSDGISNFRPLLI